MILSTAHAAALQARFEAGRTYAPSRITPAQEAAALARLAAAQRARRLAVAEFNAARQREVAARYPTPEVLRILAAREARVVALRGVA